MNTAKPGLDELSDEAIKNHVGTTSFLRGKTYANSNLVRQIDFDKASINLSGQVLGSSPTPYSTNLNLKIVDNNIYKIAGSSCSCPVRHACKHVTALALNGRHLLYVPSVSKDMVIASDSSSKQKLGDWEQQLSLLYYPPIKTETTPIALLFELVLVNDYGSLSNPTFGIPDSKKTKLKLGIRPAAYNSVTGNWTVSTINWKNTRYKDYRFDDTQMSFLNEFWTLYISGLQGGYGYYNERYLFLEDFASSQIISLLAYGQELGIAYLNEGQAREPITILDKSATVMVVIDNTTNGDLSLTNQIFIDNKAIKSESVGFIGSPARLIYIWSGDYNRYHYSPLYLARLESIVPDKVIETVKHSSRTDIPKTDIPKFMATQYAKLAQQQTMKIAPAVNLSLPVIHNPKLELEINYHNLGELILSWNWRYQVGSNNYSVPIYFQQKEAPSVAVRNEISEQIILTSLKYTSAQIYEMWPLNYLRVAQLAPVTSLSGDRMILFIQTILPAIKELPDVLVVESSDVPNFVEFTEKPSIEVGVSESSGSTDWFNLSVVVKLNQEQVPFNELFTALADNEDYLILASGSYIRLNHPELDRLRVLIAEARELQDKSSDSLTLSPFHASLWEELIELGVITHQTETWQRSIKGLLDLQSVPKVSVPKDLKAELRPYQIEGYQWLYFLWEHNLGGILADDMGLGKTLQTIALILQIKSTTPKKDRRPLLIIAPTSVAANWESELTRFAPSLKQYNLRKSISDPNKLWAIVKDKDVIISTYGLFRRSFVSFEAIQWSALVLDEAQFVKNHLSKSYQAAKKLNTPFKLVLSGTPMENNLMELWSLLSIAAAGLFPSPKRFNDFYLKPIEKEGNQDILNQLRRRIRPLMLRRTKEQVASELPPKIEQTLELELSPDHQRVYDTFLQRERQRVLGLLGDMDKNRFMIFKSITTLRLLSLDARLVDAKKYSHITSTKLNGFFEQLDLVLSEGHRALVFSQFTSYLKLLKTELDRRQIGYVYLDGASKNRSKLLTEFKESNKPLFLISLKAGGFGLNLTEADYCFLLDPWWNPAVEQQAIDRTHRIGQKKQVIVYRLVAKGTIEEKVMALKERKGKLFKSIMDEGATFASAITSEDIKALFD